MKTTITVRMATIFLASVLAVKASAQDGHAVAIEGLGQTRCKDIGSIIQKDPKVFAGVAEWLSGFLTAANRYEADTFDLTPWQDRAYFTQQLLATCDRRHEASLSDVAFGYIDFLRDKRLRTPSDLIILEGPSGRIAIYESVLVEVRKKLIEGNYDVTSEASYSSDLAQALRQFQTDKGLPVTGQPALSTLVALFGR